jgi:5-methylcytosine-specific restriction endonuclease McrA
MAKGKREQSLQDVLRARRGVPALLSPEQLRQRETARQREDKERQRRADEAAAARLVARWRSEGTRVDSEGRLSAATYGAVFADEPEAYFASAHWARRTKAQLARTAACEVERCGGTTELRAQHLQHDSLGAERAGADLVTLCAGCHRRARRRSLELGRLLTREELRALDPEAPLFDPDAIAALRERYDLG